MPHDITNSTLLNTFRKILGYLPTRRRMQFWILSAAMLFSACFETMALGCVAFFASVVTDPEAVMQSRYIITAQKFLHADFLTNTQGLIVSLSILVVSLVIVKNMILSFVLFWSSRFSAFVDGFYGELLLQNFILRHYEWHLYQNSADLIMAVDWRRYFGVHFIYPVLQMFADGFVALLMLMVLFWVEPFISLVTISVLGGTAFLILVTVRKTLDENTKICSQYQQSVNRQVTKSIHGVKDVKVFGKQDFFISNYSKKVYYLARREAFKQFFTRTPSWALETLGFIMITGSICAMMFLMKSSTVQITGTIALIAVTAWRVLPAMSRIVSGITSLRTALPYVHNAFTYLKEAKRAEDRRLNKSRMNHQRVSFEQELKFENISFSYTEANSFALQNINFTIKKGQTVGIIGPSGAGKSTLVDILIGLLPPTSGKVVIDNESLDTKNSSGWMDLLGYVSQTPYIYDGSLAENVAFGVGDSRIDSSRVSECCNMAAMDFLSDLPHGLDTQIGERGLRLSGGQRQRVAIARALYHQPQVMVFDEATSALDAKNEMDIQKTIYSLKGSLTLIIIAHRLTTVKDCDLIFCIDKGEMVKTGPPHIILPWYERYGDHKENSNNPKAKKN
ncbi:MAG: ABC transporter ATP-binding protein [Thermodesulfobacteriota bacterium]|nr:ABC transporter ATP-binding protein [Thermodesulfobacteriota bacterium]